MGKTTHTKPSILSHFQACCLARIAKGDKPTGKTIRSYLEEVGIARSKPAFYIMMGGLDNDGLVTGEMHSRLVKGQRINERSYDLTKAGEQKLKTVFSLYNDLQKNSST